mmetsp:Transcript_7758/g.18770  ORF Transcript_7758/g.18770 Transcript_7758/m.18770 type:complete len:341 (-) Transcript_7758:1001-2023(-)
MAADVHLGLEGRLGRLLVIAAVVPGTCGSSSADVQVMIVVVPIGRAALLRAGIAVAGARCTVLILLPGRGTAVAIAVTHTRPVRSVLVVVTSGVAWVRARRVVVARVVTTPACLLLVSILVPPVVVRRRTVVVVTTATIPGTALGVVARSVPSFSTVVPDVAVGRGIGILVVSPLRGSVVVVIIGLHRMRKTAIRHVAPTLHPVSTSRRLALRASPVVHLSLLLLLLLLRYPVIVGSLREILLLALQRRRLFRYLDAGRVSVHHPIHVVQEPASQHVATPTQPVPAGDRDSFALVLVGAHGTSRVVVRILPVLLIIHVKVSIVRHSGTNKVLLGRCPSGV